jgi:tRNA pseudouridine13 synthase
LDVPEIEKKLGISVYATKTVGFGGVIRKVSEDFMVEEILTDGSKASVAPSERPSRLGRYLVCVLAKRNWDTLLAVRAIAQQLKINHERITIAGIKDTKAVTAQHISLYGIRPEEISRIKIKNAGVYPVRYAKEKISPELLFGNQFTIVVRSIPFERDKVEELVRATKDELAALGGAPNFFGHQRFGTVRPITHLVGKAIVEGNLEEAAFIFLAYSSGWEHSAMIEARKKLREAKDFKEALNDFPVYFKYERLMLKHLVSYPNDFLGAFRELPRKLRELFVQALQSFLFNRFLSERIRQGISLNEVNVGDFVLPFDEHGLPSKSGETATTESLAKLNKAVAEGKACVAIPLVGFRQLLSSGVQKEIEQKILEEENAKSQDFEVSAMHEVDAGGGLRAVLTPLIDFVADKPIQDSKTVSKCELRLRFALHKGSYATIPLRELMKPQNPVEAGF